MMVGGNLRWLAGNGSEALSNGVSFGMPWPQGLYFSGQAFIIATDSHEHQLDSRELAFWADGSLKWTAHSVSGNIEYSENYTVKGASATQEKKNERIGVTVGRKDEKIFVSTRSRICVEFSSPGSSSLFESLSLNGQRVCTKATIVASINKKKYQTIVNEVIVENATFSRAVVKVSGAVVSSGDSNEHLPFDIRVYIYSDASSVKIIHSFIHDLNFDESLTSLGLQFSVPLDTTELHNRHVRLGGSNGGILKEEVKGLSGMRFGPTTQNKIDQTAGRAVDLKEDELERTDLHKGLSYIPSWNSYSLSQLSSDGFSIKKQTKSGCSWVKVIGSSRADGTAYVGSARTGGLAVGMSDFWERYPTQIDLTGLTKKEGAITMWLYSPLAEPLDTSPYHDGLEMDTYEKQLEALNVTYEDYEPGFATANGIGRTNQLFIKPYTATPSNAELSAFSSLVRNEPRLLPSPEYMHTTSVFVGSWSPSSDNLGSSPSAKESSISSNLSFLFDFYASQISQNRWYGFFDHGDVQHTYDPIRHAWRYDVGGYAWDNSELSTDLWLWLYFLRTGRSDVFKVAEAMTRHTSEVDVYHSGRFKGFGTRHGVQHWSDSSKQLRISNVLYRRIYYYLTGDERIGDLITELEECQIALLGLDAHRKVQKHGDIPPGFAMANIGLDCGALLASWLASWERRSPSWERSRDLLITLLNGISELQHGIGNNAILLNPQTGEVRSCPPPTPEHHIAHLSMLFGFPEIITEVLHYISSSHPLVVSNFRKVYLSYCKAYNGGPTIQLNEFGFIFPKQATWRQSHSTLTAFAAKELGDEKLGRDAWRQFFETDGYPQNHNWSVLKTSPPEYFAEGEEAQWVTTNEVARYGVSAIVNLANVREYL